MIDLFKYKGHTKERWCVVVEKTHFPSDCVTIATSNWIIARVSIGMNDNKADAQLIQDAPLLLAEIERLQEMVEVMKNCYNCKNLYNEATLPACCISDCCENDKWEIAE